jgi:hypothetical protein
VGKDAACHPTEKCPSRHFESSSEKQFQNKLANARVAGCNNSRFLLLPWVRVQGLASKILGQAARQLPDEREPLYGYLPLLLETLVEEDRFRGTCYPAANWLALGRTQGRGRMDREHRSPLRPKLLFVYPLCRNVQHQLSEDPTRDPIRLLFPHDSS